MKAGCTVQPVDYPDSQCLQYSLVVMSEGMCVQDVDRMGQRFLQDKQSFVFPFCCLPFDRVEAVSRKSDLWLSSEMTVPQTHNTLISLMVLHGVPNASILSGNEHLKQNEFQTFSYLVSIRLFFPYSLEERPWTKEESTEMILMETAPR